MTNKIATVVALAVFVAGFVRPARGDLDAEQVRSAIERGISYLERQQNNDGSWSDQAGTVGGVTALCTLSLLNAGVPASDEHIQKALGYLRKIDVSGAGTTTYSASLQVMVYAAAEPKKDLLLIRRNAKWLEEAQVKKGPTAGAWTYTPSDDHGGDNSNSQFALLALYEAQRTGIAIDDRTWKLAQNYWQKWQNENGGWGYVPGRAGSGSMTCAGIAALVIASDELNKGDAQIDGGEVRCCGQQQANDPLENALGWLKTNFSVDNNPGDPAGHWLYYLYGMERAGRMTNRRFIGTHDWYREGANKLVGAQDRLEGYWKGVGHGEDDTHVGTSFALLFLAKGRRPILIAKLKHDPDNDWNNHRSDLANLTSYVEKKWERDLTWQIIDPANATVDDLLQSPVLFISGRNAPRFTKPQIEGMREYVNRGGFIFAEACCGGSKFEAGFRDLMTQMFPEQEYKLQTLGPEHPIWRAEEPVSPSSRYAGRVEGINIGCRTGVVLVPEDLSCYWELARVGRGRELPDDVRKQVADANALGINVLAYATNRELKFKDERFATPPGEAPADDSQRGVLRVARLSHAGGCNAAPGAAANLLRVAGEKLKIRVSTDVQEVAATDERLFNYHLIFMHGRQSFKFSPQERKQVRLYLERGGVLFADAICSSKEFNESFRREMKALFPEQPLDRIPAVHPLFSTQFGGDDLSRVSRREPERAKPGGPLKIHVREGEPYLEGITLGDRYAVIFSRYDVSCALENHESLECEGYTRADAARIGINVLLYSLHQ